MAFSLVPYSRKVCIDDIQIFKKRDAFISLDIRRYIFGRQVGPSHYFVVCQHVDARTPRYITGARRDDKAIAVAHQAIVTMRQRKYTQYSELIAYRLRKHIQRQKEQAIVEQYGS